MASHLQLINLKVTSLLVMVMSAAIITASAGDTDICNHHEAEVRMRLEQLNKPAVESIESLDGDIIDCVAIENQPAFDHPLLRNHTIQMMPSSEPEDDITETTGKMPKAILQLWHMNKECPENTVPIRRTKEEDLLRSDSLQSFGKKSYKTIQQVVSSDLSASVHDHAVTTTNGKFYGSKSFINVWQPFVQQPDEFSLAQTWIVAGSGSSLNTIEAGWQVYRNLYGDYNTRLFIYWTRDNYQRTGCYNLLCSGFVQTDRTFVLGGTLKPISVYGGAQYEISLLIWRDKPTGNWWLQIQGINVGYWPRTLFTTLSDSGNRVDWGGEIVNAQTGGRHTTTDMGSGHFPEEGFRKAAYFRNLQIVDGSNTLRNPPSLGTFATKPKCYNVRIGGAGTTWGTHFYYGGPGRNPNCP